jgi:hypothetical protein
MLILSAAELQIRQDGSFFLYMRRRIQPAPSGGGDASQGRGRRRMEPATSGGHRFTALQAVQSRSFAFMYDVGWSLRRAGRAFVMRNFILPDMLKNRCCFFRIANANTLRCRIANSAGREVFSYTCDAEYSLRRVRGATRRRDGGDAEWSLRRAGDTVLPNLQFGRHEYKHL